MTKRAISQPKRRIKSNSAGKSIKRPTLMITLLCIIAVPQWESALAIASLGVRPCALSVRYQVIKCNVSSTAIPMTIEAVIIIPMSTGCPHHESSPNTMTIGNAFGIDRHCQEGSRPRTCQAASRIRCHYSSSTRPGPAYSRPRHL